MLFCFFLFVFGFFLRSGQSWLTVRGKRFFFPKKLKGKRNDGGDDLGWEQREMQYVPAVLLLLRLADGMEAVRAADWTQMVRTMMT